MAQVLCQKVANFTGISNGPFNGALPRNTFRRPGTQFHNISFLKNWTLKEGVRLQLRSEFYNLFNHPNLYINYYSNVITNFAFTPSKNAAGVPADGIPGVTASYANNRQIVMALKLNF